MEPDTVAPAAVETKPEVMASVEDGPTQTLIIADVTTDEAYLTLPLADAASLPAWR